jgi:hypothetical protein
MIAEMKVHQVKMVVRLESKMYSWLEKMEDMRMTGEAQTRAEIKIGLQEMKAIKMEANQ